MKVNPYIGFSEFWIMVIGIPFTAMFVPLYGMGESLEEFFGEFLTHFGFSLLFTLSFWSFNRGLVIFWRKRIPQFELAARRNLYQFSSMAVGVPLIYLLIHFTVDICVGTPEHVGKDSFSVRGLITIYLVSITFLLIYETIWFFQQTKAAVVQAERMKSSHIQTELTNIRNQINPHFLFNSLNTLMNLIPPESTRAQNYLVKLSKFYRYAVGKKSEVVVSLRQELINIEIYRDLLQERFDENIRFDIDFPDGPNTHILPMTLQLLVENAVKHNIVSSQQPLHISIFTENGYIVVKNNLQRKISETESTGTGLGNIRERYAYFTDKKVVIEEDEAHFCVRIPYLQNPEV